MPQRILDHFLIQVVAPILIQVLMSGDCCLCLHLQTVRRHAVHRLYNSIKAGQDPQMLLHVIILAVLKDRRSHVRILDAVISQKRRCQVLLQVHMRESLGVLPGDLVVAGPKCFLLLICQTADPVLQKNDGSKIISESPV